jgi:hypothetical protein
VPAAGPADESGTTAEWKALSIEFNSSRIKIRSLNVPLYPKATVAQGLSFPDLRHVRG